MIFDPETYISTDRKIELIRMLHTDEKTNMTEEEARRFIYKAYGGLFGREILKALSAYPHERTNR